MASRPINHITHPDEPYPSRQALAAATRSQRQGRFVVETRKLPISKAGAIDALGERIGIPIPEMIFGDNMVAIRHPASGWSLRFDAGDALDAVDKTDKHMLKVAYARDWEATRESTTQKIKEVVKPYDWSYSTTYAGTLEAGPAFAPTHSAIPIELLKRRDPILFFDDVVLYESELDDNGISLYSAKLRVHEHRMLLLCRLFMRLDNVVVRIRDTRIYVDFDTDTVIREYTAKEGTFDQVKRVSCRCQGQGGERQKLTFRRSPCRDVCPTTSPSVCEMRTFSTHCYRLSSKRRKLFAWQGRCQRETRVCPDGVVGNGYIYMHSRRLKWKYT